MALLELIDWLKGISDHEGSGLPTRLHRFGTVPNKIHNERAMIRKLRNEI